MRNLWCTKWQWDNFSPSAFVLAYKDRSTAVHNSFIRSSPSAHNHNQDSLVKNALKTYGRCESGKTHTINGRSDKHINGKKVQLAKPGYRWKNNIKAVLNRVVLLTCTQSPAVYQRPPQNTITESKKVGGVRLKTQLSWFCILLPIVTTCFGLARPSSGRNVVHKEENTHNCLYTGVM
jgi:hypothetical protein